MGFFSELKEDLSQAVNEIVTDEPVEENKVLEEVTEDILEDSEEVEVDLLEQVAQMDLVEEENQAESVEVEVPEVEPVEDETVELEEDSFHFELEKLLENVDDIVVPEEYEIESNEIEGLEEILNQNDLENQIAMDTSEIPEEKEEALEESILDVKEKQENAFGGRKMENRTVSDDVAVITEGMTIKGDLEAEGSVDLLGTVNGNINILGKLNVTGVINGNSQADEVYADNAKITGDIQSEGSTKIGQNTVIIGNVYAKSAVIAGAIKGDIDVHGPVILDSSAIVMGNIKSKAVQINNGAVIEGMCSQCYAEVSPTSYFEEIDNRMKR